MKSKKESKTKEIKAQTQEHNNGFPEPKKGFREPKNVLSGKSSQHQAAALKHQFEKEQISEQVAIIPADKEHNEETTSPAAAVKPVEIPDNDKDIVTLRFEDTGEFLNTLKQFQNENNHLELALDFDETYLIGVPLDMVEPFRKFMTGKGIKEIPENTVEDKIRDVQNNRSRLAIAIDQKIKAKRVGLKNRPSDLRDWSQNPNTLDLLGVDAPGEK